ncbi:tRNA (uridine-5-oxyacetic acid methyl ester) 34 synthase [Rhodopirellula maiorica SM1]|uniref:Carboxy-S-adenosyl-L-methionine synthase n=1 Tax=Rhodopirellula maiorica SM1 TaxID=1265738 RepID=M5RJP4_9BACT|nr:carboxy-S-adenosyl-L-methionine synthase CmoA [Rhodopirellula maiorica]EMI19525.1 tRNA (uridine-5-oxyacetic acid methyl ester) 34 synthase [Rhodopirellula maiorica SM1]
MKRDRIYSLPHDRVGSFAFDEQVVEVFPDMIARSVPGYASILAMIQQLAARFAQAKTNVYDLGCSLGAATLLIQRQVPQDCVIHAVDNAPAMVERLQMKLQHSERQTGVAEVRVHQADVCQFPMTNASFVVLNLTLQFIPKDQRAALLTAIADAIVPGGALLLSEKICFDDLGQQSLLNDLHHDFKRANGYSDLEIAQKRTALEDRLLPETMQTHIDRLETAGFDCVAPWFQCFNFASILAVKAESAA